MDLEFFKKALDSLLDWPTRIGILGGEPTLHPQFSEFCDELQKRFSPEKLDLLTAGGPKYERYKDVIAKTFAHVNYNPHNPHQEQICRHQRITMAIGDVVKDDNLRAELIDDCWVQRTWCPTIGPKGAFFCEIAYCLDSILDGPGGYPVEPGWWKRKVPEEVQDQISRYCNRCGMPLPMERDLLNQKFEYISPGLLADFKAHNLPGVEPDKCVVMDVVLNRDQVNENKKTWYPGNYRQDIHSDEQCHEGKGSTK